MASAGLRVKSHGHNEPADVARQSCSSDRGLCLALDVTQVVVVAADQRVAIGEPVIANQVRRRELDLPDRMLVAAVVRSPGSCNRSTAKATTQVPVH